MPPACISTITCMIGWNTCQRHVPTSVDVRMVTSADGCIIIILTDGAITSGGGGRHATHGEYHCHTRCHYSKKTQIFTAHTITAIHTSSYKKIFELIKDGLSRCQFGILNRKFLFKLPHHFFEMLDWHLKKIGSLICNIS